MIAISFAQLAQLLNGHWLHSDAMSSTIDKVVIDSRQINAGCLFIALVGDRFDGHDFAHQALAQNAAAIIVNRPLPLPIAQLVVADTRLALGQLAAWLRQQMHCKVVALTGSSGKTSVKEMTAAILQQCGQVLYTAGNFNNDIGAPLTLLRLTPADQFAVIELGANHQHEIAYTVSLTQPDVALINNISAAHLAGFGSLAGVAQAKGEIFSGLPANGIAVINQQSQSESWQPLLADKRVWRFSLDEQQDVEFFASDCQVTAIGTYFTLHTPMGQQPIQLPLLGEHNIANALAASALALAVGASLANVQVGLAQVKPVKGRLFPIQLTASQLLLDDSYNANVGSMLAAINILARLPGVRILVVGDMAELGQYSVACHQQVGEHAAKQKLDHVLSLGVESQKIAQCSGVGESFTDKSALLARLQQLLAQHSQATVLVKGSRSAKMEEIVQALEEKRSC